MLNAVQSEKPMELLTDSSISQSYHVDRGRELKPWVPDENVPQDADLENVFDHSWNRYTHMYLNFSSNVFYWIIGCLVC